MAVIETVIEIARPPAEVRAVVLDFARMHEWHKDFLKTLKPLPEGKTPQEMEKGDPLLLKFLAVKHTCKVYSARKENSEDGLAWEGGPALLFHGIHSMKFESIDGGKRTKVRHGETFTGIFGKGVALPGIKGNVAKLYEGYNRDLKKRCEGMKA